MKTLKYLKNSAIATALLLSVAYTTSCTSDTGIIGVPPSNETIKTSVKIFDVYSSTFKLDSVEARSSSSYLGAIYDPETNGKLKANFRTETPSHQEMQTTIPVATVSSCNSISTNISATSIHR